MSEERQAATAAALDEASVANGKATMYVLAQYAREEHPTAKVLDLRESDQGDWLTVWTVETDEDDEEELDDDGGYASSLYSDVWALRELYSEFDVRGAIEYTPRSGIASFRMDVAKVLAECGPEPVEGTRITLVIDFDETLVSPQFMADHIIELEGVASVRIEEAQEKS